MKRSFAALLIGASMIPAAAVAQDAPQEILMRRPLPNYKPGSDTPVTTPTPTPTPDQPGGANDYYGWTLTCSPAKLSCMRAAVTDNDTTIGEVDLTLCPATQSDEKNELARERGWIPPDAGIDKDTGTSICGGQPDPTPDPDPEPTDPGNGDWPKTAHIGVGMCSAGGMDIQCLRATANSQEEIDNLTMDSMPADLASCASQNPSDPFYQTLIGMIGQAPGITLVAPKDIQSSQGAACEEPPPSTIGFVTGMMCENDVPRCMEATYEASGPEGSRRYEVFRLQDSWDMSSCENPNPDLSADDLAVLRLNNMSRPGRNPCGTPSVYAANGACSTTVTYDAGWPQSGQAHVNTGFHLQCYAVRDAGTPDMTTSKVAESYCNGQQATPEQQAMLAALAPTLYNPATMDRTCAPNGGVNLNYQRDTVSSTEPDIWDRESSRYLDSYGISGPGWAQAWGLYELTYTFPFVCTDVDAGTGERPSYFDPYSENGGSAFKSNYPVTRSPCDVQHLADFNSLRSGKTQPSYRYDLSKESIIQQCRETLDYYGDNSAPPGRVAQCGVTVETNNRDTITFKVRRWYQLAL